MIQKRAQDVYKALLDYVNRLRSDYRLWMALPREVDCWWRERSKMQLVADNAGWRITGPGSDRARLAYARLDGDRLVYEIDTPRRDEKETYTGTPALQIAQPHQALVRKHG